MTETQGRTSPEIQEPELKPCPFCGGDAMLYDRGVKSQYWEAGCRTDDCVVSYGAECYYDTKDEAVARWNTRHLDADALADELEREVMGQGTIRDAWDKCEVIVARLREVGQ